jgi:hypothetical protein
MYTHQTHRNNGLYQSEGRALIKNNLKRIYLVAPWQLVNYERIDRRVPSILRALHDDDIGCCCYSAHSFLSSSTLDLSSQHGLTAAPLDIQALSYIHVYRLATGLYKTSLMSTAEAQTSGRARTV